MLAPVITADLHLTNQQFGSLTIWFLAAYTASQGLSGRLYDRIGTRRGFSFQEVRDLGSDDEDLRQLQD